MPVSVNHECAICSDLRFIHPTINGKVDYSKLIPCKCVNGRILEEKRQRMLRLCTLPEHTEHMTFENYKVRPGKANSKCLQQAYEYAKLIASGEGEIKWLTMISGVDTGKTHLAIATCRQWLKQGKPAKFITASRMLDELRNGYEENGEEGYYAKFQFYTKVPLLVVDELVMDYINSKWAEDKLFSIINDRLLNCKEMIVTSNNSIDDLPTRIGSRLRRESWMRVVPMVATEYRIYKESQK